MGITSEDFVLNRIKKSTATQKKLFLSILSLWLAFSALKDTSYASPVGFTITDDTGRTTVFDRPVSRIVSLYTGHTENIVAIGARDMLVAVSQADDHLIIGSLPRMGVKPGIEQIVALRPDVVLTRPMLERSQKAFYDKIRSLGVKVISLDPPAWNEFHAYIGLLGRLTGLSENASKSFEESRKRISRFSTEHEKTGKKRPGVFLVTNGRTMATCTPGSWAARMIETAGGVNVADDAKPISPESVIANFGAERILANNMNIDVVLLQKGAMNSLDAKHFMKDPRFASMRAVRSGNVFDIAEADISRPSLLRLQSGVIDDLCKLIAVGGESR